GDDRHARARRFRAPHAVRCCSPGAARPRADSRLRFLTHSVDQLLTASKVPATGYVEISLARGIVPHFPAANRQNSVLKSEVWPGSFRSTVSAVVPASGGSVRL